MCALKNYLPFLWSCFATEYHEKCYINKCELNCKQLLIHLFIVALYTFIANYENESTFFSTFSLHLLMSGVEHGHLFFSILSIDCESYVRQICAYHMHTNPSLRINHMPNRNRKLCYWYAFSWDRAHLFYLKFHICHTFLAAHNYLL